MNINTVVCEEVQHLRSKTTQKYTAVKKLAAKDSVKFRVGLSGTPIYNRGSEIWPIVDILKPGLLGNFKEFCECEECKKIYWEGTHIKNLQKFVLELNEKLVC